MCLWCPVTTDASDTSDTSDTNDSGDIKQLKHASGKSSVGSRPAELRNLDLWPSPQEKKTDEAGVKNPPFSCPVDNTNSLGVVQVYLDVHRGSNGGMGSR